MSLQPSPGGSYSITVRVWFARRLRNLHFVWHCGGLNMGPLGLENENNSPSGSSEACCVEPHASALRAQEAEVSRSERIDEADCVLQQSPVPMWIFDVSTFAFLAVNDAAIRQYGYSRHEFLSMTILDIRPSTDVQPLLREELLEHRHASRGEVWTHRKKDGTLVTVEITSREVAFQGRKAELVIALPMS